MARLFLTEEELEQFPTISDLTSKIGDANIEEWGFCLNINGEFALGEDTAEWQIVIPIRDIHEEACTAFGMDYSPSNVKVVYYVEIYPDPNSVDFQLVNLSDYKEFKEEITKYPPIIVGDITN